VSRLPALVLIACAACAQQGASKRAITRDVALLEIPNRPVNLPPFARPDLAGKVVMIYFLATWCFPCVADLPVLARLQEELGPKGYATIAVGMDLEGPRVLRPFAETYALPFPLVWASDEVRSGMTAFGRISELPARLLFARDGSVVLAYSGVADPQQLMQAVRSAVEAM
jgi:thiol-disulfide isomerase/thioredoxin